MSERIVYGEDDRLIAWAEERIPGCRFRSDAHTIGREVAGELRAAVIFDTFSHNDCLLHLASDGTRRWMTRRFAVEAMAYPFLQLRMRRVTALVSELNPASLRFTRHFGWSEEGRMRQAGALGEDLLLFGLLREECPFLPPALF